jgi:NAD(P)-dependent dehydrogenase (short-subunit alcohol dehydrogenase family)
LDLQGCRTLVTGGSSGIGAGLAEALAERGAIVGICGRRDDLLSEVIGRCMKHSPDSRMWVTNLADPDAVDKLAVDVLDAFGGVDLLVNNAGIPKRRHTTALDIDTITAVMHINYLSPMRLTYDLLPQMLARGSGTIVNISSIAATLSAPGEAAYDASKAALTAFSEAMAVDLWETGIKVMVVYPICRSRPSRCRRWPTPFWPGWTPARPRSTSPSTSRTSPPPRLRTSAHSWRAPRAICVSRRRRRARISGNEDGA